MIEHRGARLPHRRRAAALFAGLLGVCASASAFNYVADAKGTWWGIQDAAPPRVDTGSIRATQVGPGQTPAFSTTLNGFAGIRVRVQRTVSGPFPGNDVPSDIFNGEMMRGFGLAFDGTDKFKSTQSVDLGGLAISRSVWVNRGASWARWVDTFTNTTNAWLTVAVAFGGQSGMGASGANSSAIVATSSGDALVTPADAWVEVATPLNGTTLVGGPQVTVVGKPAPFRGAMTFAGNWLHDTFTSPLVYAGHDESNGLITGF